MEDEVSMHRELAPADVASLVDALLDGIRRGELAASPREVEFLRSVSELLTANGRRNARSSSSAAV